MSLTLIRVDTIQEPCHICKRIQHLSCDCWSKVNRNSFKNKQNDGEQRQKRNDNSCFFLAKAYQIYIHLISVKKLFFLFSSWDPFLVTSRMAVVDDKVRDPTLDVQTLVGKKWYQPFVFIISPFLVHSVVASILNHSDLVFWCPPKHVQTLFAVRQYKALLGFKG